jgi:hypothetical protein
MDGVERAERGLRDVRRPRGVRHRRWEGEGIEELVRALQDEAER